MFTEAVPGALKSNLELLSKEKFIKEFYLAGGTSVALQLGHRVSYDLDFFTSKTFNEERIIQNLSDLGNLKIDQRTEQTILGILNNVKVSFFFYRYSLLFNPLVWQGIRLADLRDVACMKIDAVQSRGTKRDFIDLYAIIKNGYTLEELLELFKKKYKRVRYNEIHIRKSLIYFVDAEKEKMPKMLKSFEWREIKKFFISEVKKL